MARRPLRWIALTGLAAATLHAPAASAQASQSLEATELFLFSLQLSGGREIVRRVSEGGVIPYREDGSCYGWQLTFAPVDRSVSIEETLILPAPAEQWGDDGDTTVAEDRQSSRTVLTFDGQKGLASHEWCVAGGDPEGPYRYVISYEGEIVGELNFRVLRLDNS